VSDPNARRRVLIVDDQPANVHTLAEVLREEYELFFATSGERALELAANGGLDLVLLDVVMPGLDGFEVCRRLSLDERTCAVPVIFVTARGEVGDETRGFDVGGVDYITKPISPPVVRARVRTHIELKEARDRLERLASLDGLTGIANRRRFDGRLDEEWRRALRAGHWLSLALVDVDYFKRYNDHYGHGRGDECLRAVARALAAVCRRPADLVARYGGEEFALILPQTDPAGACEIVAACLGQVRALALEHAGSDCDTHVTVSVGAVSLVPGDPHGASPSLELADKMLYEAKAGGRRSGIHLDVAASNKRTMSTGPASGGHR
jgi:diguanylate cyclase (GGDEF)-like protein